jgi:hypothetical protein
MKYLIKESQKQIILEAINDRIKEVQEDGVELTKKIVEDTKSHASINLKMMLTWGAAIGGFMGPIMQWLNGQVPELTEKDSSLIAAGIASVIFFQERSFINKSIIKKIKEDGLEEPFKLGAIKANQLKTVLAGFLKSLNLSAFTVTNMLSYAFLVPVIPMIYDAVSEGVWDMRDTEMLVKSLSAFGLITISGNFLKRLMDLIVDRITK